MKVLTVPLYWRLLGRVCGDHHCLWMMMVVHASVTVRVRFQINSKIWHMPIVKNYYSELRNLCQS